jgi:hypothetical protein
MLKQVVWAMMLAVLALTRHALAQPADPSVRLDKLFGGDMLNVQVPYLESVLGPAKRIYARAEGGKWREYGIKGCVVYALIINNETRAFRAPLSAKCTLDARRVLLDATGMMSGVTFGTLATAFYETRFLPSCLTNCGNAADPVYSFWGKLPHSAGFLEVVASSYDSEGAMTLLAAFRKVMTDTDIAMGRYNCNAQYHVIAQKAFRNARISEITIGFGLEPGQPKCN